MGVTNNNNGHKSGMSLLNRLVDINLSDEQIKNILDERAALLARTEDIAGQQVIKQYVTFQLGDERYGFEVRLVEEIQPVKDLTPIPCTPDFIVGAVNVRGSILPVVDIKSLFSLPATGLRPSSKIMVVSAGDIRMGVLADQVEEVIDIATDQISPQIATLSGATEEFIDGVTNDAIIIINMAALAGDKRMIIHQDA